MEALQVPSCLNLTRGPGDSTPSDLSFEQVVKNKALPPCDLNSFMDYLLHVERRAENLQFFLWYCDYVERWSQLLPRQKLLSPVWDPDKSAGARPGPRASVHSRSDSAKLTNILTILENTRAGISEPGLGGGGDRSVREDLVSPRDPRPRSPVAESPCCVEARHDWQPYTIQPFRDEMTRAIRHYIAESSPRQLDLFPQERSACLAAAQHTTHPSALLPAFLAADGLLRARSYPAFARWSLRNANRPRLAFVAAAGALTACLGLALDVVLILSGASRWARVACAALWWPGLGVLLAAARGVCVFMYCRGAQALRPWEQRYSDLEAGRVEIVDGAGGASVVDAKNKARASSISCEETEDEEDGGGSSRRSTFSRLDPLRKASLQAFGPPNGPEDDGSDDWAGWYARRPLSRRVFAEPAIPAQNAALRALRRRVVLGAFLWAGLVAGTLAVASVFVPSGRLF